MNLLQRVGRLLEANDYKKAESEINRRKNDLSDANKEALYYLYYEKAKRLYKGNFSGDTVIDLLKFAIKLKNTYQANELLGDIFVTNAKKQTDDEALATLKKAKNYYYEAQRGMNFMLQHLKQSPKLTRRLEKINVKLNDINKEIRKLQPKKEKKVVKRPRRERDIIDLANIYATGAQVTRAEKELKQVKFNPENLTLQEVLLKMDLVKGNYLGAEERIEQMLDLNLPDKKFIELVIKLSRICIKDERFQDAYYMLKVLYKKYPKNSEVICEIINFYIVTRNYEHALFIMENYSRDLDNYMRDYITKTLYYLRHVLGIKQENESLSEENRKVESYFERQVREYSEKKCIEYNDQTYKNVDRTSLKPMLVSKTENVYNRLREKIANLKPVYRGLTDLYIVDLRRVLGKVYNMQTSMFEVETISNTKDILSFKPIGREYKETGNIKRMSKS